MRPPTNPSANVQQLANQVTKLETRLATLQKCVQIDSTGQNLTLKVPMNITIEAGASIDIKGGAQMTLVGSIIKLN